MRLLKFSIYGIGTGVFARKSVPFVIPGLIRNPVFFRMVSLLDAASVIPDLIRDRHDGRKLSAFVHIIVADAGFSDAAE